MIKARLVNSSNKSLPKAIIIIVIIIRRREEEEEVVFCSSLSQQCSRQIYTRHAIR
jgi:hypothetical protein